MPPVREHRCGVQALQLRQDRTRIPALLQPLEGAVGQQHRAAAEAWRRSQEPTVEPEPLPPMRPYGPIDVSRATFHDHAHRHGGLDGLAAAAVPLQSVILVRLRAHGGVRARGDKGV